MKTSKLERLLAQQAALTEQIRREQEKQRKEDRARDTRRKVLAGAAVLDEADKQDDSGRYINEQFRKGLYALLDSFLTKPYDRVLFGLSITREEEEGMKRAAAEQARKGAPGAPEHNPELGESVEDIVPPRPERQYASA